MSKLGKNLTDYATHKRAAFTGPYHLPCLEVKEGSGPHSRSYKEYRVSAKFSTNFFIDECLLDSNREVHALAVKRSKESIINEVFGEFKQPLLGLRQKLMQRGAYDLADDVTTIMDQMFSV